MHLYTYFFIVNLQKIRQNENMNAFFKNFLSSILYLVTLMIVYVISSYIIVTLNHIYDQIHYLIFLTQIQEVLYQFLFKLNAMQLLALLFEIHFTL